MDIHNLPIIGICGFSGSGKTTLIEQVVSRFHHRNLRVAVVKHSSKALDIDQPGKDSDRFYQAGADVFLEDRNGTFFRCHADENSFIQQVHTDISRKYDLVLVEGYKFSPITKIWLLHDGETEPPEQAGSIISVLGRHQDRVEPAVQIIDEFLKDQWLKTEIIACILIGGKSSRMGRPKHLLPSGSRTWVEKSYEKAVQVADQVIIAGQGELPDKSWLRLPDVPGVAGPLAGILSVMRWHPWSSVLVCACDMPDITQEALEWLIAQRQPGVWAVLPQIVDQYHEPLLAMYDFRAAHILENLVAENKMRPSLIHAHPKVSVISPPAELRHAWRNVNFPEEINE